VSSNVNPTTIVITTLCLLVTGGVGLYFAANKGLSTAAQTPGSSKSFEKGVERTLMEFEHNFKGVHQQLGMHDRQLQAINEKLRQQGETLRLIRCDILGPEAPGCSLRGR